ICKRRKDKPQEGKCWSFNYELGSNHVEPETGRVSFIDPGGDWSSHCLLDCVLHAQVEIPGGGGGGASAGAASHRAWLLCARQHRSAVTTVSTTNEKISKAAAVEL